MNQAEIEALAVGMAPAIRDAIHRAIQPLILRIVSLEARKPEKGDPGKPGQDGFGLDDFDIEPCEDGRSVVLSFTKGEVRNEFELTFPVPIDRGVYKAGEEYAPGDGVTWGGSFWIAQRATNAKPDTPDSGWRLAVKKGRDGKDAHG